MRWLWIAFAFWMSAVSSMAIEPGVRMLNGDRLSGAYVRQSGGVSYFDAPWSGEPVAVPSRFVGSVTLSAADASSGLPARITLHNGDRFRAELLGLEGDALILETSWASRIEFPLNRVAGIDYPSGRGGTLYQGPGPLAEWRVSDVANQQPEEGAVMELPDGLALMKPVALERTLPPVDGPFALEWRLDTSSSQIQYAFQISGIGRDGGEPLTHGFMVAPSLVYYRLTGKNNRSRDTWRLMSRERPLIQSGSNRFRFDIDPVNGDLAFWIGDTLIHRWRDGHLSREKETFTPGFGLMVNRMNGSTVLESIRMLSIPPGLEGEEAEAVEAADDATRVVLRNGDVLEGELVEVAGSVVRLRHAATGRVIELPPDRLERLLPPAGRRIPPRRHNRDVVVRANRGGDRLTVRLLDVDGRFLTFGLDGLDDPQRFPMKRVEKLTFNPYVEYRLDTDPFREQSAVRLIE